MHFCLKKRFLLEKPNVDNLSKPIWVHCASVGEFNTFKPILRELKSREQVVLTYFSPRAKGYLEKQSGLYDLLFPLPLDLPFLLRRFESLIQPKVLIIVEREFWPALIKATRVKKILVNAYARGNFLEKLLLPNFKLIIARTERDRELFEREGAGKVVSCGNLKFVQENDLQPINLKIPEGYKLWVAGSTREGEEEIILEAFLEVRKSLPLKLVIAPRHVSRVKEVEKVLRGKGLSYARRSSMGEEWDILLVDTLGELKAMYSLADVAFVGGTFYPAGGHNLLEPAFFGKPVVFGPSTYKVRDLEEFLLSSGYGFKVSSLKELVATVEKLLKEGFTPAGDLKSYSQQVKECYIRTISGEL
ncbi:3-deoxy-D-manno-octulosonic-acid transferase [Hydrogenivirga caldilitoris]|uniref:3-deoxy-D-manno-octulosonic acid transferase n=1 Tax=Hydrogenivirga caldilitoris TaxID=246264 RepID=A0A497XNU2_9AQUI|nr:glycosyltransferase N-terminal domain-containing protein [Hydrogenivirga caldilitoris]RLJ70615.1 3-deoxy-D-manno-octulosonic-acid transferase [Hydrogenivirga caldilitoris]